MPPARAIAIAISDSVTVSIAAETSGTFSSMPRVNRDSVDDVLRMRERVTRDEQDVVEGERDVGAHARRAVRGRLLGTRRPALADGWVAGRVLDRVEVAMAKRRRRVVEVQCCEAR